ncbi:MAG: ABC transporter ATP-binding protein [Chloroflexi bacterium]|nr:ABC transporter ATP-binding protein [Chloroflexota bacterium]
MHHTLEVLNLKFSYPDGHAALHGVTLSIAPGEKVALVGPNGAGKSTLFLHFNGILMGEGEVRVCGLPIQKGLPEAEVRQRVEKALAAVDMSDYLNRISHHLSVGEKKRIAIATVLSMNPEILVLDEPTAGLDPRARRGLINLLKTLPQTIFASTHDLRFVRDLFPRTVIMDQGLIVADGATEKILNDVALLEAHGLEKP